MPRARLLLDPLPPMLRDIIGDALAGERGVEVVECRDGKDLAESVARSGADVVLVEERGPGLSDAHLSLMYTHPHLKLLTISPDGRRAALFRLVPHRRVVTDVSPGGLVDAIRRAVRAGGGE